MIRVENITKSYGEVKVLNGVDLQIQSGEVVSIMGKSGAGKSTLLHIMGTLDQPDGGKVFFDDVDVFQQNKKDLSNFRNQEIGFVFQFHQLLPEFTAVENVMIPALIAETPKKEAREKAKSLLSYLGMDHRFEHKPNALSGGEQQRVAMARALVNAPRVILADEPSGNLDSQTSEDLHNLILQLRKDMGQSFVIVTHNKDLAQLSDRTVIIQDGVIKSSGQNPQED